MLAILLLSTFCLAQGVKVKMQVDDNHMCSFNGGPAVMKNGWNKVWEYEKESVTTMACWFQNTGGPKGCLMTIDGKPTDPTAWKCTSSSRPNANDKKFAVGFDDSTWSSGVKINGPRKSFEGGDWWWGNGGNEVICRLNLGPSVQVKLQVDDIHKCAVNGQVKWKGSRWNEVKTYNEASISTLACYFRNGGGPKGCLMTIDGKPTDPTAWKCTSLSREPGDNDGMFGVGFDDSAWSSGVKINGPRKSFEGGDWWWGPANANLVICRLKLGVQAAQIAGNVKAVDCDDGAPEGGQVKIRVDDELKAYVDGEVKADAFKMPGWQWTKIWTIEAGGAGLLALRMYNQGGPGYGVGNMNNQDLFKLGMKCRYFDNGQNPDTLFPGWANDRNFNEDGWTAPAAVRSSGGAGIISGAQGFWANPSSKKNALCRLKLRKPCTIGLQGKVNNFELQVDDIHKVSVDGVVKSSGSRWNQVYSFEVGSFSSIAIYAQNGGGPKGIMMKINGKATDPTKWKCQIVNSEGDADSKFPGWRGKDYDDSTWTLRGKGISGPRKTKDLGPWWWAEGNNDNRCICILRLDHYY